MQPVTPFPSTIRAGNNTFLLSNSKTLSGNNTTTAVPIFGITGDVLVKRLWATVTTVIGVNHTGGFFKLNDSTTTVNITLNTGGATLSAAPVGTTLSKTGLAAVIATVTSASVGAVLEPSAAGGLIMSEFMVLKKATGVTNIEYSYATTDTPTSGVIQFFVEYLPISANGAVTAL